MYKLILILFLPFTIYSQNMWEMRAWVSGNVDKFEVVDTNNIYCISDKGLTNYLDKSTDGGKSWFLVNDLTKYEVNGALDIEVIDSIIFISFFSNGVILKSTDYGKTFEKIELPYKYEIRDVIMFDKNNGIASMPLRIYSTTDGWKTYDTIPFPFTHSHYNSEKLNSKEFLNHLLIFKGDYLSPSSVYLQKYNFYSNTYENYKVPYDRIFEKICVINDSVYYLAGNVNALWGGSSQDAIFKTTDGGKSWRTLLTLYADKSKGVIPDSYPFGLQDIAFKNDSVGIAVGQFGKILYTYDGGESWYYEQKLPELINSKDPPTMLITYAGDRAIIGTFTGVILTLEKDNLSPKPEDTLTISGKIISEDSLAVSCIPIRLIRQSDSKSVRVTMTDTEGNYKFTKVAQGQYTVKALNKYYDGGPSQYSYEPYFYSPIYTLDIEKDTIGIDFNAIKDDIIVSYSGSVLNGEKGVSGVALQVNYIMNGKIIGDVVDTLTTDNDGNYQGESRKKAEYLIRIISPGYTHTPKQYQFVLNNDTTGFNFYVTPITSVEVPQKFQVRANVLYSEDVAGMEYRVVSLSGSTIKSGTLPKELDLNTYPTGTYILNIVKGEEIIFTHKFQVVK